jgi:ABC-type multidrug transport system permease subunit
VYYLDPFRYLLGSLMSFTMWNVTVEHREREYGSFDPPAGQTCGAYMADFLARSPGYLRDAVSLCFHMYVKMEY